MLKIDLHTHSQASPDGSLNFADYERMLSTTLDIIAITDHDTTNFATEAHKKLGARIIIGEEITTNQGELIGLFLHKTIPAGLDVLEAAREIKAQGGLVYVPHPFETVRKGLQESALDSIADLADIVETHNGRAIFQNYSSKAQMWAAKHRSATASSSDAHGWHGWGNTFSCVTATPTAKTLTQLLIDCTERGNGTVGARGVLYPKLNRLRKKAGHA